MGRVNFSQLKSGDALSWLKTSSVPQSQTDQILGLWGPLFEPQLILNSSHVVPSLQSDWLFLLNHAEIMAFFSAGVVFALLFLGGSALSQMFSWLPWRRNLEPGSSFHQNTVSPSRHHLWTNSTGFPVILWCCYSFPISLALLLEYKLHETRIHVVIDSIS